MAYRYDMYTHCGAQEALFAGVYWEAEAGEAEMVNPPFDWADPYQKGTMTRTSETSAVFAAEGHEKRFVLRPYATAFGQVCS